MDNVGRPPKYSEEILQKAKEYLATWKELEDIIPNIEGLSEHIGIARSTVYKWAEEDDKAEFSDIVEQVLNKQGRTLINGSLKGDLNPSISKVLLSKHNYVEKKETEHSGNLNISQILDSLDE